MNCQNITVHAVSFDRQGGPAFYASLPGDGATLKQNRAGGTGDKNHLASVLLDHVAAMENPLWKSRLSFDKEVFPIHVVHGPLGRPHLLLGEDRVPAISFSEGGGRVWAALCRDESDIGIDVAGADEFQGKYPLLRVFHDQELQHAVRLTGGDRENAAALLWSIKEAVVKALGCAFHLVAPRQVLVSPALSADGGYTFPVCLSRQALDKSSMDTGRSIWVRSFPLSFPLDRMWLSIALLSRQSPWDDDGSYNINKQQIQSANS